MHDATRTQVQESLERIKQEVGETMNLLHADDPEGVDWDNLTARSTFRTIFNVVTTAQGKEEIRGTK